MDNFNVQPVMDGYSAETNMEIDAKCTQMEPNGVQMERNVPKPLKRLPEAAPKYIKTQKHCPFLVVCFPSQCNPGG